MKAMSACILLLVPTLAAGAPETVEVVPVEVQALRDVRVPTEVSGRVLNRPENESAAVQAGAVVVTIDSVLLRAGARAAQANLRRAEARDEWTRLELKRVRGLFESGTVGQAELDQAQVAAREAAAGRAAAEAQAVEVETRLARTKIQAPFDGKLVRIYPQTGEYMRVGETAFRLIDDSTLKIVVYVPARLLHRLAVGAPLRVETDLAGVELPVLDAKVFSIAPAAEGAARTYRVEARVVDASGRWRPGMTGRVALKR